ncbi:MAG: NAD(P)-dependent dehydrogenase (short-subunit alcohol dehydrogenase family) [Bacteroidia bacterium]|jgi:NAD(P)-dependent dehydrogenase (short-subunit alcohol dehydrogenase family)
MSEFNGRIVLVTGAASGIGRSVALEPAPRGSSVGVANKPGYTASKHAIVGLTRANALQYAREGISINAVCPGAVDTPMLDANLSDSSQKSLVAANHPIRRLATSEDITAAILWLCSDASAYVTGQALAVDGGLTVQ